MKEQFESKRAELLYCFGLLGVLKLILKERSFHTVDLIQSDSVEDKYVKGKKKV